MHGFRGSLKRSRNFFAKTIRKFSRRFRSVEEVLTRKQDTALYFFLPETRHPFFQCIESLHIQLYSSESAWRRMRPKLLLDKLLHTAELRTKASKIPKLVFACVFASLFIAGSCTVADSTSTNTSCTSTVQRLFATIQLPCL